MYILNLRRERGEGATAYTRRVADEARQVRNHMFEAGYSLEEAGVRIAEYEELIREALMNQLPEPLKKGLRNLPAGALEEPSGNLGQGVHYGRGQHRG